MSPEFKDPPKSFGVWIFWVGLFLLLLLRLVPNLPVWIGYGFFVLLILILVLEQMRQKQHNSSSKIK